MPGKEPGATGSSAKTQRMVEDRPSRLATGDRIAIAVGCLAAAVAVAIVAFEHAFPSATTTAWRIILFGAIAVALGSVGYLIFDLVIRPRLPMQNRGRILGRVLLGIVLLCVLGIGSYVVLYWPTTFLQSDQQTLRSPPEPTGPLLSRLDHFILKCDVPPPPPDKTVTDTLWELRDYKQKMDVLGDAIGVAYTMETIRGGVRLEAEAVTEEAKRRMPLSKLGVTKVTLEVRRIEKYELVSVIIKLPPLYAFYGFIPPNPQAPDSILVVQTIEHFVGAKPGSCRIV